MAGKLDSVDAQLWHRYYGKVMQDYIDKANELDDVKRLLEKSGYDEAIRVSFPFTFVNELTEVKLNGLTKLVNGVGRSIIEREISEKLTHLLKAIEKELDDISGIKNISQLELIMSEFYDIERETIGLINNPDIKYKYTFEPKSSAYAEPHLVREYIVFDWIKSINKVEFYRTRLLELRDKIIIKRKLNPKDPLPFITITLQIAVLLVSVPGYILRYTGKQPMGFIIALVATSIAISIILVFISPYTILNVFAQILVPGAFIYYWYFKNKNRVSEKIVA